MRSSAIAASDPRLISFQANGIKVWQRGEFVAHLSRNKKVLAIVGSHGKTTTSGMLVWALKKLVLMRLIWSEAVLGILHFPLDIFLKVLLACA